jgi:transcriptional regulator with XRE-family HTH domain
MNSNNTPMRFRHILKRLMKERGISTKVLSAATAVPASTISEWLNSDREPKLNGNILKVARFFGVALEYLITGEEPEVNMIKDLVENLEESFLQVHQGTYRITIERQSSDKKDKTKISIKEQE